MKPTKSLFISILIVFAITFAQFAMPGPALAARLCGGPSSSIYYVDSSAPTGTKDGCSWATAYLTLQDALKIHPGRAATRSAWQMAPITRMKAPGRRTTNATAPLRW